MTGQMLQEKVANQLALNHKSAEDKTEYTKPTVEGTLYPVDGEYKVRVITESLEEAKKVLEALFTPQEAA